MPRAIIGSTPRSAAAARRSAAITEMKQQVKEGGWDSGLDARAPGTLASLRGKFLRRLGREAGGGRFDMRLALTVMALALLATAASASDEATAQALKEAQEHYRKGETLMFEEDFATAAAEFRMATRLDPDYTLAYYSLGQANMALGRYDEAEAAYLGCRDTISARSLLDVKKRGEARQARADELLEIDAALERWGGTDAPPNHITIQLQERRRLLEQQQEKDAVNPVAVPAELSIALGSAYFRQRKLDHAEREYEAAIDAGDQTGTAQNNVAVIYMMTGRYDEAKQSVQWAEEAGFRVDPRFKEDLEKRAAAAP
jgi:Flp pilus assembly protein TadD